MTALRILSARWEERPIRMRLPFQFGNTEVWGAPEAYLTLTAEIGGKVVTGRSAQLMVPRWFNKDTRLSNDDTIAELRRVVEASVARLLGRSGSVAALSREVRQDVAAALPEVPRLAAGFGPALAEMALIDALCRALGLPFWKAAQDDAFGLAATVATDEADALRQSLSRIGPPKRVILRHTIGFDAPLFAADIGATRPDDGWPVALDEVIAATGITAFKIKLKGAPDADLTRLDAICGVIGGIAGLAVTLDANEQYRPDAFADFVARFRRHDGLGRLRAATRFVEQPFAREIALGTAVDSPIPLVIDESDDSDDAFETALAQGWSGTSIKSCKGVLRALRNRARADRAGAILSGEDLTCQPGLSWQQDTAMMAACGVADVERNGHHFAGGLQGLDPADRDALVDRHPDIYRRDAGGIALRIAGGAVAIGSLDGPGFGHGQPDP